MGGTLAFPQGFPWGAATAAHQVEGGNRNTDWWRSTQARTLRPSALLYRDIARANALPATS